MKDLPAANSGGHPSFSRHPRPGKGNEIMALEQRIKALEIEIAQARKAEKNLGKGSMSEAIRTLKDQISHYHARISELTR